MNCRSTDLATRSGPGPTISRASLGIMAAVLLSSPAQAAPSDVTGKLKARAVQACRSDARRLCPGTLFDEVAAARCLSTKRPDLTPSCRRAYDAVAHALKR